MLASLQELFSSDAFMPHGHCYLWTPAMVWIQVLSNGAIGLSYVAISATLAYLVRRVGDIPFKLMYLAFGVFIITCGITHLWDVVVIWKPYYWADGFFRTITAVASVGTALMLPPLIPKAVAIARGAKAAHDKGIELEQVVRDLGTMYERTKELEQLKTQFFANVSHELRTPLALIIAPTDRMLTDGSLGAKHRKDLEMVRRNANLLLRQVNDLLDASKMESGHAQAEYADADLATLVRQTAAPFDTIAADKKVTYEVNAPESVPAQVDPDKVQRVLLNLLANAFKFTPSGGKVRCELRVSGERGAPSAILEVADSGPGVPEQSRAVVFERFRQLEGGSTRRFGGTGLGLAIAKDFTELHRGRISLHDAPEGGALFRVELPLRAPEGISVRPANRVELAPELAQGVAGELARPVEPGVAPANAEARGHVLVVEDNAELNRFLADTLAAECRVTSAPDGTEGLRLAQALRPDLIITDMMMPGLTGEQLLQKVRADPALRATSVMVLTAKADDELRLSLLRSGAQDYVMKPFSAPEVLARAHNLLALKRTRDILETELATTSSDLAQLAARLAAQQRELRTALETAEVARDQAERASQVKSHFLSMVSHELRTPLTSMRLQTAALRRAQPPLSEKQRTTIDRLDASCRRLEELVTSLLESAQLRSGRLTVRTAEVDVPRLVGEVVEELRIQADTKPLGLRMQRAEPVPPLTTDPRILRLIVGNLVSNAIKYTEHGEVTVAVETLGGLHRVAVTDTGPGISAEDRGRIFEPFEQLEHVRRKHTPGVGLGLALVREMVEALGGELTVESEVGKGSTFAVVLPPAQDSADAGPALRDGSEAGRDDA